MATFTPKVIENLNQAAKAWERDWDRSIILNITSGGRPTWTATGRGGAILQKTGRLRNAISVYTKNEGNGKYEFIAKVQGIKYARIHQYGGVIKPVNAKAIAIPLTPEASKKGPRDWPDGELIYVKSEGKAPTLCTQAKGNSKKKGYKKGDMIAQYVLVKAVTIPGRPYLVVQKEDARLLKERMKTAIGKGMKK